MRNKAIRVQFRVNSTEEIDMLRKAIITIAASCIALTASACNTVKGLGNDIELVGKAGDRAVN